MLTKSSQLMVLDPRQWKNFQSAIADFDFPTPEPVVEEATEEEVEESAEEAAEAVSRGVKQQLRKVEEAEELPLLKSEEAEDGLNEVEVEEEPEEELSFEQALAESEITFIDDDFSDRLQPKDDKGSKKRRKYHEVEYDPDLDVNIVRRRRKGDSEEDNWEEYLD